MNFVVANTPTPLAFHAPTIPDVLPQIQHNPPGEEIITGTTFRETALRETDQLSKTVLQIEQNFAKIAQLVRCVDSRQAFRDPNGLPFKFLPEWSSYYELYSNLLYSSKTTAMELKMEAARLVPLVSDPHVSLHDKQRELKAYIEDLDDFQESDQAREYQNLRERVRKFGRVLIEETRTHSTNVDERLKTISDNISRLEELKVPEGFLSVCRVVLSGVLGYGILGGMDERTRETQGKKGDISKLKLELESLLTRQADLEKIGAEVVQLASSINDIFNRLGVMQQIWTHIRYDATWLQEAMVQLPIARTVAVLRVRIRHIEELCHMLGRTLDIVAL